MITRLLFGDIGGTNTRIASGLFNAENDLIIEHIHIYQSADYSSFQDILTLFLNTYQLDKKIFTQYALR